MLQRTQWEILALVIFVFPIALFTILQSTRLVDSTAHLQEEEIFPSLPRFHKNSSNTVHHGSEHVKSSTALLPTKTTIRKTKNDNTTRQNGILPTDNQIGRMFSNFSNNLARGANLMTSVSGCHIAAWVYYQSLKRMTPDCDLTRSKIHQLWLHRNGSNPIPSDLQPYDTVYVHKRMVQPFVENTLPFLQTPIILLTGSYENSHSFRIPMHCVKQILDNPVILKWFCTNIFDTVGLKILPPKLHPMALGVEPFGKNPRMHPSPVSVIRDTLLRHASFGRWEDLPNKTIGVFEAYTSPHTNPNRANMPRGTRMLLPDYLEQMAKSKFVISPNGHKPDCFRHYEALGFGAIPITELDPTLYSHLRAGPVVFSNRQWWNLTERDVLHLLQVSEHPSVNRNLIFEEYWMEDMENIVGHPLRWHDIKEHRQSNLKDFQLYFDEVPIMIKSAWLDYSSNSSLMLENYIGERSFRRKKKAIATEVAMTRVLDDAILPSVSKQPSLLWGPTRFNNFTTNLARGANLMTSISGCHIAAWIYIKGNQKQNKDCGFHRSNPKQRLDLRSDTLPAIEAYDTIYVHTRMVKDFVTNFLPGLKVPIILLSGSYDNTRNSRVPDSIIETIIETPLIDHWFCQNLYNSTGLTELPSKIHPMALGVEPFGKDPLGQPNPVVIIRDTILRYSYRLPNKTVGVFEAYTSPYTNPNRRNMPRDVMMPLPEYLEYLAKSKFVISPNGHKPDCFRHYEALAFGAIPITELDPLFYSHLRAGPIVFNNSQWWNLTESQVLSQLNLTNFPAVNRNLIFEEYWMEDMEKLVGRPVRWYDIRRQERSFLKDFYLNYDQIATIVDSAWIDYSNDSAVVLQKFIGERQAWIQKDWPPRISREKPV